MILCHSGFPSSLATKSSRPTPTPCWPLIAPQRLCFLSYHPCEAKCRLGDKEHSGQQNLSQWMHRHRAAYPNIETTFSSSSGNTSSGMSACFADEKASVELAKVMQLCLGLVSRLLYLPKGHQATSGVPLLPHTICISCSECDDIHHAVTSIPSGANAQ